MDDISTMLDQEYEKTLKAVSMAPPGSDEAKWQMQKLNDLHKQRMNERESNQKTLQIQKDIELKESQLKGEKKDRIIKLVYDGTTFILSTAVSSYWMAKGLKFEESGSFKSRVWNWISNQRLFKK